MAKVLTIASGKGGVGKTSISLNLSLALANAGYRVCLLDADMGLANVNILTGLYPETGLAEVIEGEKTLMDIMIRGFHRIDIIPGSSGVERLADLTGPEANRLIRGFLALPDYDYFIIDTSAGVSAQVLSFCRACHEMILVATPEPTSLTDAYSLLKVLSRQGNMPTIRVIINQVQSAESAKQAYAKLKKTVHKFLSVKLAPLGILVRDPNVPVAVVSQIPFFILFPDTQASRCIRSMAMKLAKNPGGDMPMESFWDHCLEFLSKTGVSKKSLPRPGQDPSPEERANTGSRDREGLENRLDTIEDKMGRLLDEMREVKEMLGRRPPEAPEAPKEVSPRTEVPETQVNEIKGNEIQTQIPFPERPIELDFEGWLASQAGMN